MLLPQLALNADIRDLRPYITDDNWVMEQKLDGHRLFLVAPGGNLPPTALTRAGTPYTRKLPRAIQDFRFPSGNWILDGELMPDGRFWCFDLPLSPLTEAQASPVPLFGRRAVLQTFLNRVPHPFCLIPQALGQEAKAKLARMAIERNLEGLMLKKVDSHYASGGRNADWLKLKFVATADVVVKRLRADGKESVEYIVYDEHTGATVEIGKASLIGKEKREQLQVGDVIEVRYLYVGADGRLYQPTVLRKRTDKRPDECTTQQLKWVNKEVIDSL